MHLQLFFCTICLISASATYLSAETIEDKQLSLFTDFVDPACVKEKKDGMSKILNNVKTCVFVRIAPIVQTILQSVDDVETIVNVTCSETSKHILKCIAMGQEEVLKLCDSKEQEENTAIALKVLHDMMDYACHNQQQFKEAIQTTDFDDASKLISDCAKRQEGSKDINGGGKFAFSEENCKQEKEFVKCVIAAWGKETSKDFLKNLFLVAIKATPCDFDLEE